MEYSSPVCPGCGAHLKEISGSVKCEYCGRVIVFENLNQENISTYAAPVQTGANLVSRPVNQKSGDITFLLWFFFGFFGVHRFYLNQKGWGILYLLTGGVFGIGWCVDFFIFMFGVFKDSHQNPTTPINPLLKKVIAGFIIFFLTLFIFASIIPGELPDYPAIIGIILAVVIVNSGSIYRFLFRKKTNNS